MSEIAAEPETHLYLIRHAQAVVNVEPIIGGMKGDTGLTPHGIAQTERLRDRFLTTGEIRPDVFVSSTLPRARETAQILAPAFPDTPIVYDDDVQELRVGKDYDGLNLNEYKRRFGWLDLSAHPLQPVNPGGESWATFALRVAVALARTTTEHAGKTIVVVCHGGVIDASFIHFFGMEGFAVPPAGFATQNTSITHWERVFHHRKMGWRLKIYNDDFHLRGLVQTPPPPSLPATPHVPVEDPGPPLS